LTSATGASIRAALGATGPELRSLLLADTLRPLGAGLAVGVCLSWLGAETVRVFLFQVDPFASVVGCSGRKRRNP